MTDLRKALEAAEAFIDRHSEPWYTSGQELLSDIRVALSAPPTADFAAGYAAGIETLRAGLVEKVENDGRANLPDAVVLDWIDRVARSLPVPASPWQAMSEDARKAAERDALVTGIGFTRRTADGGEEYLPVNEVFIHGSPPTGGA